MCKRLERTIAALLPLQLAARQKEASADGAAAVPGILSVAYVVRRRLQQQRQNRNRILARTAAVTIAIVIVIIIIISIIARPSYAAYLPVRHCAA